MASRFGATSLVPVIAIAGLLGVGAAGYRIATGNCPLSCFSCDGESKTALVQVADETEGSCGLCPSSKAQLVAQTTAGDCPMKASCDTELACDKTAACDQMASCDKAATCQSDLKTVAHEAGKSECAKECKGLKDGCTGDGKDGCCGGCSEEKKAEKPESVATSGR